MTKTERNIIYSMPVISICFEIAKSFITTDTVIMAGRNYLFFLIILYLSIKYFKSVAQFNIYLVIIIVYFLIELIVTESKLDAYNKWIQFIDAKMLLPLGFVLTSTYDHIKTLNRQLLITNILFVVSIIIFSLFGIGKNQYGGDSGFKSGAFIFSAIYIGSYLLIVLPVQYNDLKSKVSKNALALLGVVTLIILVLSVRRSALVIVLIGATVYMYLYRRQLYKFIPNALVVAIIIVLSYPLYRETLNKQIEARGDVFNDKDVTENLQEETRLAETIAVYEERILNPDARIFFLGEHFFDSAGKYAGGVHKERPLHLDVNIVLHGTGLVGLIIFLLIYVKLFHKYISLKTKLPLPNEKLLMGAFMAMFLSHLFLLISGGMITMTFNLISSLYMGGILGLYRSARAGTLPPVEDHSMVIANTTTKTRKVSRPKPYIYEVSDTKGI